jgi:hypothetical protein
MILSAQAVPSSAMLPCIAELPSGCTADGADTGNGRVVFRLDSDKAGPRAVTVTLTAACNRSGAVRVPSDQPGAERYERPLTLQPRSTLVRMYVVTGGCITYQFSFATGAAPSLAIFVGEAIAFEPRSVLVGSIRHSEGLTLCGRGAPPCPSKHVGGLGQAGPPEPSILATPRRAAVFAAAADSVALMHIQRLADSWLRLMISGRNIPVTAIANVFNVLGLV